MSAHLGEICQKIRFSAGDNFTACSDDYIKGIPNTVFQMVDSMYEQITGVSEIVTEIPACDGSGSVILNPFEHAPDWETS